MCLYLDTNIWLDLFDQNRAKSTTARYFLAKIIDEKRTVLFSEMVLIELKILGLSQDEIACLLNRHEIPFLRKVPNEKGFAQIARQISLQRKVSKGDVLHALLTKKHGATLISRDKDFEKLKDICSCKKPEQV